MTATEPSTLRRGAGTAWRRAVTALQRIDPARLALEPAPAPLRIALVGVYRACNVHNVRSLAEQVPDAEVRWWSLDSVPPELAVSTVGVGPGNRSQLLNRLVATLPPALDAIVLADDDLRFVVGDLRRLIEAGRLLDLDVFQPAHVADSVANWEFVRKRAWTFGRTTGFVEQGPLLVVGPRGRDLVLPLPEDKGMSWGIEVRWSLAAERLGARLGIVDAVGIRHSGPVAGAYDRAAAEQVLVDEVRRGGLDSIEELHVVHDLVRPAAAWRRSRTRSDERR